MKHKKNNDQENHLEKLKWETAQQLGLADDLRKTPAFSAPETQGKLGNMVRRLIKEGAKALATEGKRMGGLQEKEVVVMEERVGFTLMVAFFIWAFFSQTD